MNEHQGGPSRGAAPPESEAHALGMDILRRASAGTPGLIDRRSWEAALLDWSMKDDSFKTDLFRFLDVLPALGSDALVARHVREYLLREGRGKRTHSLSATSHCVGCVRGACA